MQREEYYLQVIDLHVYMQRINFEHSSFKICIASYNHWQTCTVSLCEYYFCALLFVTSMRLDEFKLFVHGMYVCTPPTYVWNSKVKKEAKLRDHCEHGCISQKVFFCFVLVDDEERVFIHQCSEFLQKKVH